ncbi:MAG: RHS repeat-associated core domain-containing protein, partial [Planctomycetaceae bacterium]|nr:RHS repeat-associated core domain-containing protein [Planctomycetaceae bacterium]
TSKNSEYFVHDNWQIVLTLDKNGSVTNKFLWGAKQDELIAQNSAYTLCDHLGTVRDLIGNGVAAHFEYNAFGQLLSKTGNTDCVFKYTGKMTDDITDLQWNINRWYDAKVGRWISIDPIGFKSRDVSLYRYVLNSPLLFFDKNGLLVTCTPYTTTSTTNTTAYAFRASSTVTTNPSPISVSPVTDLICNEVEAETRIRTCTRTLCGFYINSWSDTQTRTRNRIWQKSIAPEAFVMAYEISITIGTPIGVGVGIVCGIHPDDQADANTRCGTAPSGTIMGAWGAWE